MVENDHELNTSMWLKFDLVDHDRVLSLRYMYMYMYTYRLLPIQGEASINLQILLGLY